MEIYKLPDREFTIIVLRKLSELLENTDRNSMKSGKKYTNKITVQKSYRNHKKGPNRNYGTEDCDE